MARFDDGAITSDGRRLLLGEVEKRTLVSGQSARCFTDHGNEALVEHTLEHLLAWRLYGLAPGYEDLNDHDDLRRDCLLETLVGRTDVTGEQSRA